jgi:hypothetical protein
MSVLIGIQGLVQMRVFFHIVMVVLGGAALLTGCKEQGSHVHAENKCHDNVTVKMGGYTLSLPRDGRFAAVTNEQSYELDTQGHCDIDHIDSVIGVRGESFGLTYGTQMNDRTTFQKYKTYIKEREDDFIDLKNGVTKYSYADGRHRIYMISPSEVSTHNHEPVVIKCLSVLCRTVYFINKNTIWGFKHRHEKDMNEDFIAINNIYLNAFKDLVVHYSEEANTE